jgi:hypothetical protein
MPQDAEQRKQMPKMDDASLPQSIVPERASKQADITESQINVSSKSRVQGF